MLIIVGACEPFHRRLSIDSGFDLDSTSYKGSAIGLFHQAQVDITVLPKVQHDETSGKASGGQTQEICTGILLSFQT